MDILASLTVKLSSYAGEMLETNFTNSPPTHSPNWVGKKLKITTKLYDKHQLHQTCSPYVDVGNLYDLSVQAVSAVPCHSHCISHTLIIMVMVVQAQLVCMLDHRSHLEANLGEGRNCTIDLDYKRGSILSSLQILLFLSDPSPIIVCSCH